LYRTDACAFIVGLTRAAASDYDYPSVTERDKPFTTSPGESTLITAGVGS